MSEDEDVKLVAVHQRRHSAAVGRDRGTTRTRRSPLYPQEPHTLATLVTKICDNDEVYLLYPSGLKSSIPRRKLGGWVNVSRYKMFLAQPERRILEKEIARSKKRVVMNGQHLEVAYRGVWVPLETARALAVRFGIQAQVQSLLEFNRLAKTQYCGFEFYEFFAHISEHVAIRVLRRVQNDYVNVEQLFSVVEWVASTGATTGASTGAGAGSSVKNDVQNGFFESGRARMRFLAEYAAAGKPMLQYGDFTLCGGTWIPLLEARQLAKREGVAELLAPLLGFAHDPARSPVARWSPLEIHVRSTWRPVAGATATATATATVPDFGPGSKHGLGYGLGFGFGRKRGPVKRYTFFGFPLAFSVGRGGGTAFAAQYKRVHELEAIVSSASASLSLSLSASAAHRVFEARTQMLDCLGACAVIRLRDWKTAHAWQEFYVMRRFSDGKINLSALLGAMMALRLYRLSRAADKDPGMQIENELYYRDALNGVRAADDVYIDARTLLPSVAFQDCAFGTKKERLALCAHRDKVIVQLAMCLNGKWGDINVARDLLRDFHFGQDDDSQHHKLAEIMYSDAFASVECLIGGGGAGDLDRDGDNGSDEDFEVVRREDYVEKKIETVDVEAETAKNTQGNWPDAKRLSNVKIKEEERGEEEFFKGFGTFSEPVPESESGSRTDVPDDANINVNTDANTSIGYSSDIDIGTDAGLIEINWSDYDLDSDSDSYSECDAIEVVEMSQANISTSQAAASAFRKDASPSVASSDDSDSDVEFVDETQQTRPQSRDQVDLAKRGRGRGRGRWRGFRRGLGLGRGLGRGLERGLERGRGRGRGRGFRRGVGRASPFGQGRKLPKRAM